MSQTDTTPKPQETVWRETVNGEFWTVVCTSVESNAEVYPECCDDEDGNATPTGRDLDRWNLEASSPLGVVAVVWFPESHILNGTLSGWGKSAIGRLKRALIERSSSSSSA